ncbi:hypothetical protein B0T25DRAFT_568754 [Lasiosphaeria hispida]|uniref:Uncharacterized protein n=1 Tax=Lasiosphaeria hispida TaxID=260671 RepID=A0AAJ0MEJ0_9PEZI|nr:hypothetical protein B0T25DRAFT_568754 [Lasiosphaeria hispida]
MGPPVLMVPHAFSWLLPAQGFVAAVVIYATVYLYGVGSIPFILAVVAAGVHFFLGIYLFATARKPRSYHLYIIPVWLIACAGLWCGVLYYFARELDLVLRSPSTTRYRETTELPLFATWSKVGIATAGLNVLIDFVMLGLFLVSAIHQTSRPNHRASTFISTPVYSPVPKTSKSKPQLSGTIGQPYNTFVTPQGHVSPVPGGVMTSPTPPLTEYKNTTPSTTVSPLSAPTPPLLQQTQTLQQQQPTQPIQPVQPVQRVQPPQPAQPIQPIYPLQSVQHVRSVSSIQLTQPTPPLQAVQQQRQPAQPYYDPVNNRIDVMSRLCSIQHPDGHWDFTPELAELVKHWGGRELMAPAHGVTALTHACLMDLCNYVWGAQREGREHTALNAGELMSLQAVNWDLVWAKNSLDRATAWLSGFR